MQCDVYACGTCDRWQQQDNTCRRHAKTQDLPSRWKIERHITQQLLHSKRQTLHVMQDAHLVSTCQCAVSTAVGISLVPSTLHHRQVRWSQEVAWYKFRWEYRPSRTSVADPIDRQACFNKIGCCTAATASDFSREADDFTTDVKEGYIAGSENVEKEQLLQRNDVYGKEAALATPRIDSVK